MAKNRHENERRRSFHTMVVRFPNFSCAMRVMALLTVEEKIRR
jgi:hypothetical protein